LVVPGDPSAVDSPAAESTSSPSDPSATPDWQVPLLAAGVEAERREHWQYWRQRQIPRYVRNGFRSDWQLDVALSDIGEHLACRYWFGSNLPRNTCGLPLPSLRALVELRIRDLFGILRAVPERELRGALGGLGWHTGYSYIRDRTKHRAAPGASRPVRLWWPARLDCAPIVGRVTGARWHALRRRPLVLWPPIEVSRQQARIAKSGCQSSAGAGLSSSTRRAGVSSPSLPASPSTTVRLAPRPTSSLPLAKGWRWRRPVS
jgi:hypothetical protein